MTIIRADWLIAHAAPRMTYPRWLNICSAIVLAMVAVGVVLMMVTRTSHVGLLVETLGWIGVCITGNLADRYRNEALRSRSPLEDNSNG
jgi:hypothetical protein